MDFIIYTIQNDATGALRYATLIIVDRDLKGAPFVGRAHREKVIPASLQRVSGAMGNTGQELICNN